MCPFASCNVGERDSAIRNIPSSFEDARGVSSFMSTETGDETLSFVAGSTQTLNTGKLSLSLRFSSIEPSL